MKFLVMAVFGLAGLWASVGPADAEFPIFDAHIHFSQPAWDTYTPERALSILARAGVRRAIVSSTPDDGTLKLYARAPKSIVPFLRPYRTREDMGGWARDASVATYVEERLQRGVYRGIGEFHLGASDVVAPVGALDPEWRKVFVRYADRFMVGTDTWVTSRWEVVRDYMRDVQVWLGQ